MPCPSNPITISQAVTGDMPLDQAIYVSAQDKIYGVRGQWVYQFNSISGALEATLRYAIDVTEMAWITSFGGNLYIGVQRVPYATFDNPVSLPTDNDIYKVALPAMNTSVKLGLNNHLNVVGSDMAYRSWCNLTNDGTYIYGRMQEQQIFRVDPTNIAGIQFDIGSPSLFADIDVIVFTHTYNGSPTPIICYTDPGGIDVWLKVFRTDNSHTSPDFTFPTTIDGLCYDSTHDVVYCTSGSHFLYKINVNEAFTVPPFLQNFSWNTYDTGRINNNAFRCKFVSQLGHPLIGKVLIPAWNDDTVLEWNTTTNNPSDMIVHSGFTAPWDVVITPSRAFAVQNGPVGLKLIV
jgi:hypothetical protein